MKCDKSLLGIIPAPRGKAAGSGEKHKGHLAVAFCISVFRDGGRKGVPAGASANCRAREGRSSGASVPEWHRLWVPVIRPWRWRDAQASAGLWFQALMKVLQGLFQRCLQCNLAWHYGFVMRQLNNRLNVLISRC